MQHPGHHARINIVQGEYHVSGDKALSITTLLGSCVAACIHDPEAGVGGMNHFLLPGNGATSPLLARHGVHLMELLINGLLKKGAARERLQAKLFGGARTMQGLGDIGATNAKFAQDFLRREGIAVSGGSLGGETGRRIQFWPASGRVMQKLVRAVDEKPLADPVLPATGDLELF
ncbi:chemotaxis protein CheD [Aestuariivirga sp.]|uniref:chemotaxis protein CheD n=1 Tax=Aestuariivirga sp. TaxID=2650926 RepID=UPI0025BB430F|nr:chemotaxis protein CheD [Aestuariivirga sp.]MCA3555389.1 chemotaxis protein CheD [Aestuariivirga sp.]